MTDTQHKQVDASHYTDEGFGPLRIESLTSQMRAIAYCGCSRILEIGVGGGHIGAFLSRFSQMEHTSIDIAEDLNPDVVGSVLDMPFNENQFELTLCCQVLEHLPFECFEVALREIRRVTTTRIILSLPDQRKRLGIAICLPRIPWFKRELNYSLRPSVNKDKWHSWEIGYKNTPNRRVKKAIINSGCKVKSNYRLEKHPWHNIWILQP